MFDALNLKGRLPLGLAFILATASLYAEGALVNGWIEVLLLVPVIWYFVSPQTIQPLQNLLVALSAVCLTVTGADLLLRPVLGAQHQLAAALHRARQAAPRCR